MQSELAALKQGQRRHTEQCESRIDEVMASKFRLIESTAREIDGLRSKIHKYTNGELF